MEGFYIERLNLNKIVKQMVMRNKKNILSKLVRISFPIWLTFILFVVSIFFLFIPSLKQNLMAQKKEGIKQLIDSNCSLFEEYQKKVEQGELTLSEAQKKAINQMRTLRYGNEGKDYFWINDKHPFMIMHPYRPELEGKDLTHFKDAQGNYPFIAMVEKVVQEGSGYVNYYWQWKDSPDKVVPKISYVKGFEPWGWILGTGIYTNDVKSEIRSVLKSLSIISIVILMILLVVSFYLTIQAIRSENERRESVDKLYQSERLHRRFIDNAPIGMYTLNLKGEFTYINKKTESITGYKKEDWLNRSFRSLVHPEDIGLVEKKFFSRLKDRGDSDPYEIRIFNSREEVIWVKITSESIYLQEKEPKTLVGVQSFLQDITQRKKAEQALRESEEKYRVLVQNANEAIFIAQDEVIKFPNPKTVEITGYSEEELAAMPFVNLIHPEDRQMVVDRYRQRLDGKKPLSEYAFRIINKSGSEMWLQLNSALTTWQDRPATINLLRDITERKQLEEKLHHVQKMESIGNLAGGIAHEFNNILSIIIGNNELVMEELPEWSLARESTEEIRIAGLRARDIVKQLLTFSRQDNADKTVIDIVSVVRESMKLIRSSIPANIDIQQNVPDDACPVLGNATQINQLLINLCNNAVDALPDTGGILSIALSTERLDEEQHPLLKPGQYVRLSVSDNGVGMNKETLDKIFDPYFTTKEFGKGTGIGLAVVHGIIERHCGSIIADSKEGKGTTFDIFLPIHESLPQDESKAQKDLPKGDERVLYVDDEYSIAKLGKRHLESLGYRVESTTDPLQALEMVKMDPGKFDLVVTDMAMPKMTGDHLVTEILKVCPEMPTIICTGYSARISEKKAIKMGVSSFIMKPLDKGELARKIRWVLDGGKG